MKYLIKYIIIACILIVLFGIVIPFLISITDTLLVLLGIGLAISSIIVLIYIIKNDFQRRKDEN